MRDIKVPILLIAFMLLPPIAVGLVPEDLVIWSEPGTVIAGGGKVTIYVKVENATLGGALSTARVQASVIGIDMGRYAEDSAAQVHVGACKIQSASHKTDEDGMVSFTFTPSTRAGTALIQFSVEYAVGKTHYHTNRVYFLPIVQVISLEEIPLSEAVCSGSRDLEFQWILNYAGTRAVVQDIYYQISEDSQVWSDDWVYLSTIDTGSSPIIGQVFGVGLDTRDRVGYFRVKVIAREGEGDGGLQYQWVEAARQTKLCASIQIR